jgi:hypothetical protein
MTRPGGKPATNRLSYGAAKIDPNLKLRYMSWTELAQDQAVSNFRRRIYQGDTKCKQLT